MVRLEIDETCQTPLNNDVFEEQWETKVPARNPHDRYIIRLYS